MITLEIDSDRLLAWGSSMHGGLQMCLGQFLLEAGEAMLEGKTPDILHGVSSEFKFARYGVVIGKISNEAEVVKDVE